MIMKRLTIMMAVLAASFTLGAQEKTKTYKFGDIKTVDASYTYHVYVTEGSAKEVEVVYDQALEDYMHVDWYAMGSRLVLRMDELPRKLRNSSFPDIKVYISMDEIDEIELSGASEIDFEGNYTASGLDIELSGASVLRGLSVKAGTMSADCSGAASFDIEGVFAGDVDMELSGAAKGCFRASGLSFDAELSGACRLDADLDFKDCDIDCSGASGAELAGKVKKVSVDGSGACSIDARNLKAEYASLDLSGASKAKIYADKEIRYEIPRSCKMTYYGNAKLINMSEDNNVVKGD